MKQFLGLMLMMMYAGMANAGQVTVPNTFTSGTKARAAEVNANFTALEQGVNDNDARITQNTADIYSNTIAISSVNSQVTSQAASIQANTADIYTNATAISSVNNQVTSQATSIQTNAAAILGNANNISTNASAITALQQNVPATYQVVDSYGNILGDVLGADMNNVTVITNQGYMTSFTNYAANSGAVDNYYGQQMTGFSVEWAGSFPSYDVYTTVDCTGAVATPNGGYANGRPMAVASNGSSLVYYPATVSTQKTVIKSFLALLNPAGLTGPICVTPTTVHPLNPTISNPLPIIFTEYFPLPNDPAVTGIPNGIDFPLRIQKK